MNKLYISKRNGEKARLIETLESTVVLQLHETGESKEISFSTLKRWWIESSGAPEEIPAQPNPKESAIAEPMKLSEVVGGLEDLFDLLNTLYFDDALVRPVITIQSTPKLYGHCSTKQIWMSEADARYEVNIGAEHISRPREQIAATMCHEMIHLYCLYNDIRDTCQNGRYHNKTFKIEAEARDLHTEYDRTNGYTHTTPTEIFTQKLANNGFDLTVPFARNTPLKQRKTGDREKPHKYTCPQCGQTVRSTQELHISCSMCEVEMECEV